MEASERKPRSKQIIIHASVYQDDLDRLRWISDTTGDNRSQVIRDAIAMYYDDLHDDADSGITDGKN